MSRSLLLGSGISIPAGMPCTWDYVKQDINNAMQGREFDKLSNTEKDKVIAQLHQAWTDPNNEVVKRMAQFKEKSPDILKPILES